MTDHHAPAGPAPMPDDVAARLTQALERAREVRDRVESRPQADAGLARLLQKSADPELVELGESLERGEVDRVALLRRDDVRALLRVEVDALRRTLSDPAVQEQLREVREQVAADLSRDRR